eukprot:TRINITY_DN4022_c0_g1_i1.p1 TRINITY_DN4022_c0_g1~~TRINITY_DN4022_c0_g1_i1.p1  ORF type:complete len:252 (-),score=47.39 TRINITY_DN4022_c0_g1_i1:160-915(-)
MKLSSMLRGLSIRPTYSNALSITRSNILQEPRCILPSSFSLSPRPSSLLYSSSQIRSFSSSRSSLYATDTTPAQTTPTTSTDLFANTLKEAEKVAPAGKKTKGETAKTSSAKFQNITGSPYKMALLANQIRGLGYQEALNQLKFSPKVLSTPLTQLLIQARYNGENNNDMDPDRLLVAEVVVGKGQYLKRQRIHAKGRVGVMHRPRTHLKVVLKEVPLQSKERRLGKFGRTHAAVRREMSQIENNTVAINY